MTYDAGVRLRGTPLSFDAVRRRELCVLTGLRERAPAAHRRTVVPSDMAAALERLGLRERLLPLPTGRWGGIGAQRLQFLAVGDGWERAAALVLIGEERVIVAGRLLAGETIVTEADHLVVEVAAPGHRGAEVAQVAVAVGEFVAQTQRDGWGAAVWVEGLGVGVLLWRALIGAGVRASAVGPLATVLGLDSANARPGVRLAVMGSRLPARRRIAWVDSGLGVWDRYASRRRAVDATFRLRYLASSAELDAAVASTGAREVTVIGAPPAATGDVGERWPGVGTRWLTTPVQLALGAVRRVAN